jgi:hypothetical protein
MTRAAAEKEKEKSAGLGTLAMGLLLYYFNKRGE